MNTTRITRKPRRRLAPAIAAALIAAGVAPVAAHAGPLYTYGPAAVHQHSSQWTLTQSGPTWQASIPEGTALAGDAWSWEWVCPVPGSQIENITFQALRTRNASSFGLYVDANGGNVWAVPDSGIAQSPSPVASEFTVNQPGGTCNVRLRGVQTETRHQHARTYFVTPVQAVVRDLTPPTINLRSIDRAEGWIGAGNNSIGVHWSAADNFGAAGIGAQHITVAGAGKWSGSPGPGDHAVTVNLDGIGDGQHEVRVSAEGGGTGGAAAAGTIRLDRTAPTGAVAATLQGATRANVRVSAADATSGVSSWQLRQGSPTGPIIATNADTPGGQVTGIDVSSYAGSTLRWHLRVTDNAGNVGTAASAALAVPAQAAAPGDPISTTIDPTKTGIEGLPPLNQLPDLAGVRLTRLSVGGPKGTLRRGKTRILQSRIAWGRNVAITGRYGYGDKAPASGIQVMLRAPGGKTVASTHTDARGRFYLMAKATKPGLWQTIAIGNPLVVGSVAITPRPPVSITSLTRKVRSGGRIVATGKVGGLRYARGRLVQLQARIGKEWRPIAQVRAKAGGKFRATYRVRGNGGYRLKVRVFVPREQGLGMWAGSTKPRTITIR